jgi:Icc-related predicted phosphoesterase
VRKLLWANVILGTLLLVLDTTCGILWATLGVPAKRRIDSMPASPQYRVAVLGDIQKGLANFANLLSEVRRENAGFILQTGDLVAENDPGHYRLVKLALERAESHIPFVVTPGNHDLKGNAELFRSEIGDLERSFVVGDVAFVLINNAFGMPPDPRHVEERIAAAGPHKAVVLAMHQPPIDLEGAPRPEYAPFLEWLKSSGVAYLLTGHVHNYQRRTIGATTVIVNGVGGDFDSWQLTQRVFATILEVDGARITDRVIDFPPEHGFIENLEHLALGHLAEAYRRHPLLCWAATILLAGAVGWGWVRLLRRRKIIATP